MDYKGLQIELNSHFKPDECVLVCGSNAYTKLPIELTEVKRALNDQYYVSWIIRALPKYKAKYATWYCIKVNKGVASMTNFPRATAFTTYAEARAVADKLLESDVFNAIDVSEIFYKTKEVY